MTTPANDTSTDPNPGAKPFYKRWWFIVIAVVLVLGLLGSLLGEDQEQTPVAAEESTTTSTGEESTSTTEAETTTTTVQQTTSSTQPPTTATTVDPGPAPVFGAGTQVVGEDIEPGIYETDVRSEGVFEGCYWERLSGFSGTFDEIIANNNVVVHDVVEIADTDAGFDSDCEAWYELAPLDEHLAAIPQGKWVIGAHISAGTYQAEGGEGCYWERLSGVSGEFNDIIANDLATGSAIVEILESDYAFNSFGCGEWTLRG
jgi:hypothetical protein